MPEFITAWWDGLNFELQIFYGIAIISTFVLVIQLVLTMFVGLDGDMDFDSGDFDSVDHDSGLGIFSFRGINAFFVGFGWTGAVCILRGLSLPVSTVLALVVGLALMMLIFVMMRSMMRLQASGTLDYGNAVGQMGTVYVTIPPADSGSGQVETMIQGRLVTAEAIQRGDAAMKPGSKVKVVERIGTSTLVVEKA